MKLSTIYLVLGGEDEIKRPRSKKLLQLVRRSQQQADEYKIIVSGLSSFDTTATTSESSRQAKYLVGHGIPKENIRIEEESLDTLGNLIFSHRIIEQLLTQSTDLPQSIVLITEGFHIHRSKKLLRRIFKDIVEQYPAVRFKFAAANPHTQAKYYWKWLLQKIRTGVEDELILDVLTVDIDIFKLHSNKDFENYLFSLPVYVTRYKANQPYNMAHSLYARAIQRLLDERASNT